jgi:hypothetical protein
MTHGLVRGRRVVASFSSWFCLPEQGMKDMEILSRASCFLTPFNNSSVANTSTSNKYNSKLGGRKFHVLTASHVVAPWRWPKHYPDEWLQHVNETHTHYTLELRHPDGTFITQAELLPQSYHHPTRDLSVLHLEDEENTLELLKSLDYFPLPITPSDTPIPQPNVDRLTFYGHNVTGIQNCL